jgi:hypothetical protein
MSQNTILDTIRNIPLSQMRFGNSQVVALMDLFRLLDCPSLGRTSEALRQHNQVITCVAVEPAESAVLSGGPPAHILLTALGLAALFHYSMTVWPILLPKPLPTMQDIRQRRIVGNQPLLYTN